MEHASRDNDSLSKSSGLSTRGNFGSTHSNSNDNSSSSGGISNSSSPSSDFDDEDGSEACFYSQNPDWADVTPIEPDPYESKVLGIPYTDRFREAHEYFRAIFRSGELSERALELTKDCISWNAANSTVWVYRRRCLLTLKRDLNVELDYLSKIIIDQPKNYQVWQHRRWLIEQLNNPKTEKEFTEKLFEQDCKNYHAWQHRQWVVSHFNCWQGELEYTEKLIEEDLRNNSAWNHRYFVIKRTNQLENHELLESEVVFTVEAILKVPDNESPWNYLRGLLAGPGLNAFPERLRVIQNLESVHSYSFRIDALEETLKNQETPDNSLVEDILVLVRKLSNEMDCIRAEYWSFIGRCISEKYGSK